MEAQCRKHKSARLRHRIWLPRSLRRQKVGTPRLTRAKVARETSVSCNNTSTEYRRKDMEHLATDTIVLIHGLWMTPLAWEHWVKRYEERGFKVITPGYPGVEQGLAGVEAPRRDPSPLAGLGVREVFDHLADV